MENALAQSRIFTLLDPSAHRIQKSIVSLDRRWKPLEKGSLKCNIYGAFLLGNEEGLVACIYKNFKGAFTDVFT